MWISESDHSKELERNRYPIIEKFHREIHRMQMAQIEPALIMCNPEHFYMLSKELNQFMHTGAIFRPMQTRYKFYIMALLGFPLLIQEVFEFKGISIFGRVPDPEYDKDLSTRIKENIG